MRPVCVTCNVEMNCRYMGVPWRPPGSDYVYDGDVYECPGGCGARIQTAWASQGVHVDRFSPTYSVQQVRDRIMKRDDDDVTGAPC